ncbi:hypothetical protein PPYR_08054, partial [Photinus pyralis]
IVSPGAVASELRREFSESELNERPMMKCEDVAKTVIYILSTPPNVQIQDIVIHGDLNIWKRTLYTNCLALSIFTREAIRVMKAHDIDGLIINNSSIAARYVPNHPLPNSSPNVYPATKFAVNALSNTLTNELRHEKSKIRVSCVSPGLTLTEIFRYEPPEVLAAVGDSIPFLTSENIADSVMFILSTPPDVQVQEIIVRPVGEFI